MLKLAEDLLRQGLHTAEIVSGYQRAYDKALELLPLLVVKKVENLRDPVQLEAAIKSVLATKQYGYEDFLSHVVSEACLTTMSASKDKKASLNVDSVRISKLRGGNITQSTVVKGMVVLRDSEGIVKRAENAKVIVFGTGIEASATEAKGTVLLKNADELLNYNRSEEKKMEETIEAIAASGVKVVISHGSISEMAQHFMDKFGLMCIKIQSKFDLRRICGALGATAVIRLGPCTPEEMGECSLVEVKEVAGRKVTVFNQLLDEDTTVATIVVRASTENVLNDVERALDDGIASVKSLCTDSRLLPGAGATELELCKQLKTFADQVLGLDQYAIRKFADALCVVPRTLAENSGQDPSLAMHALHASHQGNDSQSQGFDIEECVPFDAAKAGIFDIYVAKLNALRLAVDSALTVLRVDQIVLSKPAGGPAPRGGKGGDE